MIPCYNEENVIANSIHDVMQQTKKLGWLTEVIVVNDGSTDSTEDIVLELMIRYPNLYYSTYKGNRGKGYAVYEGFRNCTFQLRLILDADLSVSPLELFTTKIPKGQYIIKGQRVQVESQPLYRVFVGKCWQIIVWIMTGMNLDSQCPYCLLNVPDEFYNDLKIDGFAFDVELLYKAKKLGIPIIKKKVMYFNDPSSSVRFRHTIQMFKDIFRIRKLY